MKQGTQECRISVLVEPKNGEHFYKTWVGRTAKGIHRQARAVYHDQYPGCRVSFGAPIYTYHYGAH